MRTREAFFDEGERKGDRRGRTRRRPSGPATPSRQTGQTQEQGRVGLGNRTRARIRKSDVRTELREKIHRLPDPDRDAPLKSAREIAGAEPVATIVETIDIRVGQIPQEQISARDPIGVRAISDDR